MYTRRLLKSLRETNDDRFHIGGNKKLYGSSTHLIATLLVLLTCLAVSVYYWYTVRNNIREDYGNAASQAISASEQAIGNRMSVYINIMTGAAGLYNASDDVTRSEWDNFIAAYNVQQQYPGASAFGYADYVLPQNLGSHIQSVRESGIPEYSIKDSGNTQPYVPVVYISPMNDQRRALLGFNMMSESTRSKAIIVARDTGHLSITGKIVLAQTKEGTAPTNQEPGLILYLPVYKHDMPTDTVEQRQAAIQGFVYTSLRVNELLKGIFGDNGNKNLALQVYDGEKKSEEALLYRSENFDRISKQNGVVHKEQVLDLGSQKTLLSYAVSPNILSSAERNAPWLTLLRGVIVSIIIAELVYYLLTNRTRKLVRAQQMEVQTAKDDLLSLASHQLRTPATVVKQYVGMLLDGYAGKLTQSQQEMLTNAYVSNERQLQIINQILYVARLDAGQLKLQKERFDLAKLVRDLAKAYKPTIKEASQHLVQRIPRKQINIKGDPQYLYMAIDNLISNATKYTPMKGKICVEVKESGKWLDVIVEDNGPGISDEEKQVIFDKFTRGQGELMGEVSGSGIGLYLVRQIAELHNGSVTVKSRKGKGTIFTLRLPKGL